ncbi:hypothetical protein bcere0022_48220 [Bacillus cereus Rock3-44]|nr:hypothetical protein bcere0022_48220 [Bacillus cereus Rock3-44]
MLHSRRLHQYIFGGNTVMYVISNIFFHEIKAYTWKKLRKFMLYFCGIDYNFAI